jgi:hypothetical protein
MVRSLTRPPAVCRSLFARRVAARGGLTGIVGAVALLAVACGSTASVLNTRPVEQAIAQSILTHRGITTVVRCPATAPLKTGYRFRCAAALDVGSYPLNVVELNAKGGVSYSSSTPLRTLNGHMVAVAIQDAIRRGQHRRRTVTCPQAILQAKGLRFSCTVKPPLGAGPVEVTETDSAGRVSFRGP